MHGIIRWMGGQQPVDSYQTFESNLYASAQQSFRGGGGEHIRYDGA